MSAAIETRPIAAWDINARVDGYDWTSILAHLDTYGSATVPKLLTASAGELDLREAGAPAQSRSPTQARARTTA